MRGLMIALFVSMVALLAASAGLAHHIWQEHRKRGHAIHAFGRADDVDIETEEAP
jgi:putative NADH-flavin reductase